MLCFITVLAFLYIKDEVIQITWMKREQIKELFEHKVLMRAIVRHKRLILLNMAIKPLG